MQNQTIQDFQLHLETTAYRMPMAQDIKNPEKNQSASCLLPLAEME